MPQPVHADPFVTKGLEYLLVIGFLPSLVLFWRWLRGPARVPARAAAGPALVRLGQWFQVQPGAYYHPGHSWALPGEGDLVRIGMDDFAQKLIGRPSRIELPSVGDRVVQGAGGWKVRADSKTIDLLSPVDGVVVARNDAVLDSPDLVNQDPYGNGWLLEVRASRMKPNLRTLLHGDVARAWMDTTLEALRLRMSDELGLAMQDGGVPVSGIARALSPDLWDEIAGDFLLSRGEAGHAAGGRDDMQGASA